MAARKAAKKSKPKAKRPAAPKPKSAARKAVERVLGREESESEPESEPVRDVAVVSITPGGTIYAQDRAWKFLPELDGEKRATWPKIRERLMPGAQIRYKLYGQWAPATPEMLRAMGEAEPERYLGL